MAHPAGPADRSSEDPARRGRSRLGRRLLAGALLTVVLVLAVGGWVAFRAYQAGTALQSVADQARGVGTAVLAGRTDDIAPAVEQIQDDAGRADRATSDPVWLLAEHLPVVGADAVAVRTVSRALHGLAQQGLPPLVRISDELSLDALRPVDGRIDLAPLAAAAPDFARAERAVERAQADVAGLDPDALHGPLVEPVTELQTQLSAAADALTAASRAASVVPSMLGAEGPRRYLALFLNSAELRAQGGIIGAVGLVTADGGRLALADHVASAEIPEWDEPVLPMTASELAIATDVVGRRIQNVAILPDTPRVGEITAEMWRRATGQTVDGVVAVDTVALSYLVGALGDLRHPDGVVLTGDTLLQTLLFDAYARQSDPRESDRFFAEAAGVAFDALASGAGEPADLVRALGRAVEERRLSVWSRHADEQSRIVGTVVDGAFLSGGHDDGVGVFLDNTSGWKTDTFLQSSLAVESTRCDGDTLTLEVRLDLASTLPVDSSSLPYYVVGDGSTGVPVGGMRMRVTVYSPVGGEVQQVRRGESFVGAHRAAAAGRDVRVMTGTLAPGETASYRFTMVAPARGPEVALWTSPTTSTPGMTTAPTGCDEA